MGGLRAEGRPHREVCRARSSREDEAAHTCARKEGESQRASAGSACGPSLLLQAAGDPSELPRGAHTTLMVQPISHTCRKAGKDLLHAVRVCVCLPCAPCAGDIHSQGADTGVVAASQ